MSVRVPHDLPYLANCSILFTEHPLLERASAAKAAGFDAIEFWWPFADSTPEKGDVDAFVASIEAASIQLVGLNLAAGNMPGGDRGLVSWVGRQDEFLASLDIAIGIGERLGVSVFNALYGNRLPDVTADEQDVLGRQNLATAARAAASIGATVVLEPLSGVATYPLLTADDVMAVVAEVRRSSGLANIGLLADLYHLTVNGDDVAKAIERHTADIAHVQIADAPGRHEPGTGDMPIQRYLDDLAERGYHGWVGLEYVPSTDTVAGLARWGSSISSRSSRSDERLGVHGAVGRGK